MTDRRGSTSRSGPNPGDGPHVPASEESTRSATDDESIDERIEALEAMVRTQQATIEELAESNERLETTIEKRERASTERTAQPDSSDQPELSRRSALAGLGLAGLAGLGVTSASAHDHGENPSGQVGTRKRPLASLYTQQLRGAPDGEQPFDLYAGGERALRIDPNGEDAPNVIAGDDSNALEGDLTGATIAGGEGNVASNGGSEYLTYNAPTIAGGRDNTVTGAFSPSIGGGSENTVTGDFSSTIGGGSDNQASGDTATISGGRFNEASGWESTIGGGQNNEASGDQSTVGGGWFHEASGGSSTVSGGTSNKASENYSTVSGGQQNEATANHATVSGGDENGASGAHSTVSGGEENVASADKSTTSGGERNEASGTHSTVAGGRNNEASGSDSTVAGGTSNEASGLYSTVAGGHNNEASERRSFAAGYNAKAVHDGSFVWSDNRHRSAISTAENQFLIDAAGGVGVGTNAPSESLHVRPQSGSVGFVLQNSGAGDGTDDGGWGMGTGHNSDNLNFYWNDDVDSSWGGMTARITTDGEYVQGSDARLKRAIEPLEDVLEDVCSLRPTRYRFRESGERSLGFIAQEVRDLFPELVTEGDDERGLLSLSYAHFAPLAIAAIGEQQELIENLECRLDRLEGDLTPSSVGKDD